MLVLIENSSEAIVLNENHSHHKYGALDFYYDGGCYLVTKDGYHFKDGSSHKELKPGSYEVLRLDSYRFYVYEDEIEFDHYGLYDRCDFIISADPRSHIVTADPNLKKHYLYFHEGKLETKSAFLLVNNKKYEGQLLSDGDEVSFLSFRMIVKTDFLYLNHFLTTIRLNAYQPDETILTFEKQLPHNADVAFYPEKELALEKIEKFLRPEEPQQHNVFLQMGPGLLMSLAMISVSGFNAYDSYLKGDDVKRTLIYLIMPVTMLVTTLIFPLLNRVYERFEYKHQLQRKRQEYLKYLNDKDQKNSKEIADYLKARNALYFKGEDENCFAIGSTSPHFLKISVGLGKLNVPFEKMESGDQGADEAYGRYLYKLSSIDNDSLFVDLKKVHRVTIICRKDNKRELFLKYLLELSYRYHPDDLQLSLFCKDKAILDMTHALPHLFAGDERLIFQKPAEVEKLKKIKDKAQVLLIYEDYKMIDDEQTVLYFSLSQRDYLKNSDVIIDYQRNVLISDRIQSFHYEYPEKISRSSFEMLGKAEHIKDHRHFSFLDNNGHQDLLERYQHTHKRLVSSFAFDEEGLIDFDLHESGSGPHGLIGGATGSGKSELIISLLLGLCLNYAPDQLNIILIDYKGGGLAESLSSDNELLPHIVASITNLEEDTFERLIALISKECRRRQTLFRELSLKKAVSIMNIDDYNQAEPGNSGLCPMPHLVIVVDEFAELKKENPEVIRELISFSRIGRSLGLHLILATQRPSGVIDDEIWSNSRFKIALKVFNEKDSQDVIRDPSAAYLKEPGSFYLSSDGALSKCQSIYAKKGTGSTDTERVAVLDYDLNAIRSYKKEEHRSISECELLCRRMIAVSKELGIKTEKLICKRPESSTAKELRDKYPEYRSADQTIYGEADDYLKAEVYPVVIDKTKDLLIFSQRSEELDCLKEILIDKTVVQISENKEEDGDRGETFTYADLRGIDHLFYCLERYEKEVYLLIEDVSAFLTYDQSYTGRLLALMNRKPKLRAWFITRKTELNFRFMSSFKQRLIIGSSNRQEQISFFGKAGEQRGDSFFMNDRVIGFTPFKPSMTKTDSLSSKKITLPMPEIIRAKADSEEILLGVDVLSREELWAKHSEKILIAAYDEKKLVTAFDIYDNVTKLVYDSHKAISEADIYIWIGEGLSSQRLFFVEKKADLLEGEAYVCCRGSGRVVRFVET